MFNIHGAKWWKFDFHVHTPCSDDYGRGNELEKKITTCDWLKLFMVKKIDCIAITDHNNGDFIDNVKQSYYHLQEERPSYFRELYIFPGVEISVNGGIHLLAIFDLSVETKHIISLLGACGYNERNKVTSESIEKVIEIISGNGGIAIPAHIDKACGLFEMQKGDTLEQTLNNNLSNLIALEMIDINYKLPEIYLQTELKLSCIVGSDSHCQSGLADVILL